MRKLYVLFVALSIAGLMVGCGGGSSNANTGGGTGTDYTGGAKGVVRISSAMINPIVALVNVDRDNPANRRLSVDMLYRMTPPASGWKDVAVKFARPHNGMPGATLAVIVFEDDHGLPEDNAPILGCYSLYLRQTGRESVWVDASGGVVHPDATKVSFRIDCSRPASMDYDKIVTVLKVLNQ